MDTAEYKTEAAVDLAIARVKCQYARSRYNRGVAAKLSSADLDDLAEACELAALEVRRQEIRSGA